ncbi:ferrous iron transport protein B [Youxingia wuxianensis]|uniref:Ferrous iron transport protein B n=1 Tax=Youxingia wuxianensis TaxID=2763678 RepID=A0A926EQ67_9FIRM|nr:ferrous iron transport protein B [Youxingia wuxianensis]MBC8584647.1 ferrous iron transport protein B [Youxingia wuxianensis]
MRTIALLGNPNCGKTTLFNKLTGSNQHVGNWAGVTVERKEGKIHTPQGDALLIDLPGIYSFGAYSPEEAVARDFLLEENVDGVINILDGTNLERNLYLTMQLLEIGCPVVVAVNMMDEIRAKGANLDIDKLARSLEVPVVGISARTGENVQQLAQTALKLKKRTRGPLYDRKLEQDIEQTQQLLKGNIHPLKGKERYYALQYLESGTLPFLVSREKKYKLSEIRENAIRRYEKIDPQTAIASERYKIVEKIAAKVYTPEENLLKTSVSDWIDKLILNKILAFPLFFLVMYGVFSVSFGNIGILLKKGMETGVFWLTKTAEALLAGIQTNPMIIGLIIDGVIGGMGAVVTFLPQIALIFFFLTLLEDCGYMARAAFIMDKPLRGLGLTGKSFIPMLMGFGCTTPAVMAARTMDTSRDRNMTILLIPFLSCGAKFPIYAMFAGVFYPHHQGQVVFGIYLLGIFVGACYGWFLKSSVYKRNDAPFLMEFPPYRLPSARELLRNTGRKCEEFLKKVGTLIFLLSIIVWILQHISLELRFVTDTSQSIFAMAGEVIAPVFSPLGFSSPEAGGALLAGLVTKEAVISALSVMCAPVPLTDALPGMFTPLSAASFLVFCLLYSPCLSALATMRRELHSWKAAALAAAVQTGIAYIAALAVYQIGLLCCRLFG